MVANVTNSTNYLDSGGTLVVDVHGARGHRRHRGRRFGDRDRLGAAIPAHPADGAAGRQDARSPAARRRTRRTPTAPTTPASATSTATAVRDHPQVGSSNAKDNSQSGCTGNVYLDAYTLTGTRAVADRPRAQHPRRRALHAVRRHRRRRRRQGGDGRQDRARHQGRRPARTSSSARRRDDDADTMIYRERRRLRPVRPRIPDRVQRPDGRGDGDGGLLRSCAARSARGATTTATASIVSSPPPPTSTPPACPASSWRAATTRARRWRR